MYTYFTKDSVFQKSRQKTPLWCFARTFTNMFEYFSTSFMPAKITSSHCGREREPRRKIKTKPTKNPNSHCHCKLFLTNEKQCQEIHLLITVLIFPQSQSLKTTDHVSQTHTYMVKQWWRRDTEIPESTFRKHFGSGKCPFFFSSFSWVHE